MESKILLKIARILLEQEQDKLNGLGYHVEFDERVAEYLVDHYADPINGARPMKRAITAEITDRLADGLLNEDFTKDDELFFAVEGNQIRIVKSQLFGDGWLPIDEELLNLKLDEFMED